MKHKLVDQIINNRTAFLEILIVAIVLAISVSGVASILFEKFKESTGYLLIGFITIIFLCIIILAKKLGNTRSHKLNIEAFLVVDPKENKLIDIPRYNYVEDLISYINGAFKENSALQSQWKKEPIGSAFDIKTKKVKKTASAKLITEATEYSILDDLSTHLTDYFNQEKYSTSELQVYSREDMPDILLSNRFMALFTTPMENRAIFDQEDTDDEHGIIVKSFGKDGAIYHKFDLTLPIKTKVSRDEFGAIKFDTENFILTINVNFDEFSFVSPRGFKKYYLGITDFERSSEYQLNIEISVEFKFITLLKSSKWDYHAWIDGFLDSIENKMSANTFFKTISWDLAYTIIQCEKVSNRLNTEEK